MLMTPTLIKNLRVGVYFFEENILGGQNVNELKKHIKESELISIVFLRWFLLASISGVTVGVVISFFLKAYNGQLVLEKLIHGYYTCYH